MIFLHFQKKVNYEYFTKKLHPDDYEEVMKAMLDHLYRGKAVYEAEYRIRDVDGNYKWYYDRGKITKRDEFNKPLFLAGIVFDITEKKKREEKIYEENIKLSTTVLLDPLTNLSNRRAINDRLKEEIDKYKTSNTIFCIIMMDIDDFKHINDNHGNLVCDKILVEMGKIMKYKVRDIDLVGRYGGEEFLIILTNTNITTAKQIANRIREKIEKTKFDNLKVTISARVA